MADNNTRKAATNRLEEVVLHFTQGQTTLTTNHQDFSVKVDAILKCLSAMTIPSLTPTCTLMSPTFPHPHITLDVPHFDGHNPLGWIFKISQFFDYQGTPNEEHITVPLFYMDDATLS